MIIQGIDFVKMIDETIKSTDERLLQIRETSRKSIDFYNGKQLERMDTVLKGLFKNWEEMKDAVPIRILGVTKKIIDALSQTYRNSPTRTILVDGKINEEATEIYNNLIENSQKSIKMRSIDRFTRLVKTTILQVYWNEGLCYRVLTPEMVDVIEDTLDPQSPHAVIYEIESANNEEFFYVYWDDDHSYTANDRGEIVSSEPYESTDQYLNPYGIIPFAVFRDSDPVGNDFWTDIDETIINCNEAANQVITDLLHIIKEQSWSQGVISGGGGYDSQSKTIERDPMSFIYIPDGKLSFESPEAKITEVQQIIDWLLRTVMYLNNLGVNTLQGQSHLASGLSILASRLDLLEDRADRLEVFTESEKKLFEIEKRIYNYHASHPKEGEQVLPLIPENASLKIDWSDLNSPLSTDERIAWDEHRIKYNLITSAQLLREQDNDIKSEEEAEKEIKKNKEFNDSQKSILGFEPSTGNNAFASEEDKETEE